MKTLETLFLFLMVSLIFLSCSGDNEIPDQDTNDTFLQERNLPMESLADIGAVEKPGFPKTIKKFQNSNLNYWAQYYYRPDGNLLKVKYSYPQSDSEIFTDTYHYDSEGKMIRLDGPDAYKFYWDKGQIIKAEKYNKEWLGSSEIFYEYNPQGQIIQRTEIYSVFFERIKFTYSYSKDGNLKTIEQYGDYYQTGIFELDFVTNYDGYTENKNLFLELEIIPGQISQDYFPTSMDLKDLTGSGYDKYENYDYKYDSEGRVIEKKFGGNRVVYQYY